MRPPKAKCSGIWGIQDRQVKLPPPGKVAIAQDMVVFNHPKRIQWVLPFDMILWPPLGRDSNLGSDKQISLTLKIEDFQQIASNLHLKYTIPTLPIDCAAIGGGSANRTLYFKLLRLLFLSSLGCFMLLYFAFRVFYISLNWRTWAADSRFWPQILNRNLRPPKAADYF